MLTAHLSGISHKGDGVTAAPSVSALYERDYYAWTQSVMQSLKARDYAQLDVNNLIEEVNDLGISFKRGLRSHLSNLLLHLLKWQYQPGIQSHSWRISIHNARTEAKTELEESPSLTHQLEDLYAAAYKKARREAELQTGLLLKTFPPDCPYTLEQALEDDWLPV